MGSRKKDIALAPRLSEKAELLWALAARCEQEEPSRGLDIDIACAVLGWEKKRTGGYLGEPPDYAWDLRPIGRGWWSDGSRHVELYTDSLDAAVAMMPEDCYWTLDNGPDAIAMAYPGRDQALGGCAKTPAMALAAAALKARAAIAELEQASMQRGKARTPPPKPKKEGR